MADLIFVLATLAFFGICVLYVNWCDRIIGPDDFGHPVETTIAVTDSADVGSAAETATLAEVTR